MHRVHLLQGRLKIFYRELLAGSEPAKNVKTFPSIFSVLANEMRSVGDFSGWWAFTWSRETHQSSIQTWNHLGHLLSKTTASRTPFPQSTNGGLEDPPLLGTSFAGAGSSFLGGVTCCLQRFFSRTSLSFLIVLMNAYKRPIVDAPCVRAKKPALALSTQT